MANITSIKKVMAAPAIEIGEAFTFSHTFTLAADLADDTDTIEFFELPDYYEIIDANLDVEGTLGASCTLQLQHYNGTTATAITAATTAGGASAVPFNGEILNAASGDVIRGLVAGADFAAATTCTVSITAKKRAATGYSSGTPTYS